MMLIIGIGTIIIGDQWRAHFFERIREDLNHVQSSTFPMSTDEYRLARTKQELANSRASWQTIVSMRRNWTT
jgi:hypothetical protein